MVGDGANHWAVGKWAVVATTAPKLEAIRVLPTLGLVVSAPHRHVQCVVAIRKLAVKGDG